MKWPVPSYVTISYPGCNNTHPITLYLRCHSTIRSVGKKSFHLLTKEFKVKPHLHPPKINSWRKVNDSSQMYCCISGSCGGKSRKHKSEMGSYLWHRISRLPIMRKSIVRSINQKEADGHLWVKFCKVSVCIITVSLSKQHLVLKE